jgi:hypothetical protein
MLLDVGRNVDRFDVLKVPETRALSRFCDRQSLAKAKFIESLGMTSLMWSSRRPSPNLTLIHITLVILKQNRRGLENW